MAASGSALRVARFERYSVDFGSSGLFRSGVRIPIQSQPFQVLRLLLESKGEVVTREQLREALWPHDTFVDFDLGVNTAVRKLRQALEDSAEHPRFIETLPKLGYRFMIPVEWRNGSDGTGTFSVDEPNAPPTSEPVSPTTPRKAHWKVKATTVLAAVVILLLLAVLVANKDGYLGRTRLGMWLRSGWFGRAPIASLVTERRLTANPEDAPVTSAVISPDGKYLAYTDTTGFYVRQVDSGETHPLPLPRGFEPLAGSWFPDSIHMIVPWLEDPTKPPSLWKISIAGGTPHKLADEGWFPSVSPSGDQVAFVTQSAATQEIWLTQADGDNRRRLHSADSVQSIGPIVWSPDGKRLAYVRSRGTEYAGQSQPRESQVETHELADGRTTTVLSRPGIEAIAWAHDGRLIYSTYEANRSDSNLWWFRPGIQTPASTTPTRLTNAPGSVSGISITSDGKQLAVIRDYLQADIFIADVGPGPVPVGASRRLTLDERDDLPYSWTPDSKAVLFVSNRDGNFHIYKQALDQTQAEMLVGGKHDLVLPRLSPDGSSILYEDDEHRLMRVALSGGPPQLVLQADSPFNLQCARLPSTLCLYGNSTVFKFDPVRGTTERFPVSVEGSSGWNLSPDGRYLCSGSLPGKSSVLSILSLADGSKMEVRLPDSVEIGGADWAGDGKSIWVAIRTTEKTWKLVNVDRKGIVRPFLETPKRHGWSRGWKGWGLGWAIPSPDGRHLAYWEMSGRSNAWLLENF
jgi:Tol biopolymer transport system component/DNA-binding winged helix-turn-helix (wHTH) protein